ncbi:MAG: hypothetical protein WC243_03665 [Patescibacteria group bacterium]|jgi:hypothetical protein
MRSIIRAIVFSFIALYATQAYIKGIDYGSNRMVSMALLVAGLSAVNFLILPILRVVGFKAKGLGGLVLRFILIGLMFYFLVPVITGIEFVATTLPELKLYDFMLPSKGLSPLMSLVFTALLFSFLYSFLDWLCPKKG